MTTTTNSSNKRSLLRRRIRSQDHGLRTRSIARDLSETAEARPRTASSEAVFVSGAKAIAPVLLALLPFGLAFGATAAGSGFSAIEALGMSVFVAAGAAQLAAVQLISNGASVAVVVLTVLVINLRLMLYSASLAPHFRGLPLGWKALLSYHLTDQAYAATITRFDEGGTRELDKRWYFLGVGLAIWTTWQAATMTGIFLGARASEGWSLDFVLPLIFIALAVPAVKDRMTGTAAVSAGVAALFTATLPLNLGLIAAALVGILVGLLTESAAERRKQ